MATPRINFGASISDLLHEVRLIRSSLEAQIARLDRIECELKVLSGVCSSSTSKPFACGPGVVAYNLHKHELPDGSVEFSIDGGKKFSLGPRLAGVFQFLYSGDNPSGDELVGWRSRKEIIKFLADSTDGKSFPSSYPNNMVNKLRDALQNAGYRRDLIQTHDQKGIRLAYKRRARSLEATIGW